MEGVVISSVWRLLGWLPGFLLRRKFSTGWLREHTNIDVRARHDPITIYGGELPHIDICLTLTNNGHFEIELDRLMFELLYGAATPSFPYLQRLLLLPGETKEVYIRGTLTEAQVKHIAKQPKGNSYISFQVKAEFNCKIANFTVDTGQLTGINPRLVNII
ncbi:conserved protein of unknown function [Georgfuchsia toluolica]|uniref:Uncharacterized protein n=1 Tax=Georgfuchsia toluolica TaxID=424218 RepID=A0A916J5C3_9PROT|nr:hypothetical protein [Georgfuchsia toluolica]CAG4883723.1 conserved protein of unknown function [Georgfuchsia toluolica]